MSLFSETITLAIKDYRFLLRRYLTQVERVVKLQELNLKDPAIYQTDLSLYRVAEKIIQDIDKNMSVPNEGYYAYSGIEQFRMYLKEYLDNYYIEGDRVVHRAQKASRALIESIQLIAMPNERLTSQVEKKLFDCNEKIVKFGSFDQCKMQLEALSKRQKDNPDFYTTIIANLESMITARFPKGTVAS